MGYGLTCFFRICFDYLSLFYYDYNYYIIIITDYVLISIVVIGINNIIFIETINNKCTLNEDKHYYTSLNLIERTFL